jgi:L-alanine-DL-glutamate epimerase-like enolase superfamily enzyme
MTEALTVERVETFVVSLPIRRPHFWVGLAATSGRGYLVVKLTLSNGVVGWGESQPIQSWGGDDASRFGETPRTAIAVLESCIGPALKDVDVRQFELLHAAMNRAVRGHPYAKAALEVAVMDAVGKTFGLPVYQLLGGRVREWIPLAHSIGLMEIDAAVAESVKVVEEGIKTLKIKIGVEAERYVAIVRAVRQAIGDEPQIRVDANQGYRSWVEALTVVQRLSDYRIAYAEQMVDGIDQMAEIARRCIVPLMADESAWTERDIVRIAQTGAAQYLSVYYTKPGGLWKAKRLLTVAGAHRMLADINGSGEMGIGNAANLHLAAAAPEIVLPGTIPVTSTADVQRTQVAGRKYLDDLIASPFVYRDGHLQVPDGPGLGIVVDEDKLHRYRAQ